MAGAERPHLLSWMSQFLTFAFQSHSWRITSNAKPPAQRMGAKRLLPFSPALSHLYLMFIEIVFFVFYLGVGAIKIVGCETKTISPTSSS